MYVNSNQPDSKLRPLEGSGSPVNNLTGETHHITNSKPLNERIEANRDIESEELTSETSSLGIDTTVQQG